MSNKIDYSHDDYEEVDSDFNPSDDEEEDNAFGSSSNSLSSDEEEEEDKEAVLDGSVHISHNEGKLVYNGIWWFSSNPEKTQKFRLKSKQSLKDNFDVLNPLINSAGSSSKKERSKRTIWMDGFFWINEYSSNTTATATEDGVAGGGKVLDNDNGGNSDARKVKERDLELTFTVTVESSSKNGEDEKKGAIISEEDNTTRTTTTTSEDNIDSNLLRLSVHGKGCNEFGSFTIQGKYTVKQSDKSNKLICKKCYSDQDNDNINQRQHTRRKYSTDDNDNSNINHNKKHSSTILPKRRHEEDDYSDDDDDDCVVDEEADFDELIALNEEANMSLEELLSRDKCSGDGRSDAQDEQPPVSKKAKIDATPESDEDEYGF